MVLLQEWNARAVRPVEWSTALYDGLLDLTPDQAPLLFGDLTVSRRRFVAVDATVWRLYGPRIVALLDRYGIQRPERVCVVPGGEGAKSRETASEILRQLEEFGVARFGEPPIVIGGGVLHDLFGLVVGSYRRGVAWIFVATTLVAAVDAMFALKCAINEGWKNRVGLYHPATRSVADLAFFATLEPRDVQEGLAEIIKVGIAGDPVLFRLVEQHGARVAAERLQGSDAAAGDIVRRAVGWMLRELQGNPWEVVTTRASYLGHTISPGMEPDLPHGQAVALDIVWTAMIAHRRGMVSAPMRDRIVDVVRSVGLSAWHPVMEDSQRLLAALADTALHRGNRQALPTPWRRIGRLRYLDDISEAELLCAVKDQYRHSITVHPRHRSVR